MRYGRRVVEGKRLAWPPSPALVTAAVICLCVTALWAMGIVELGKLFKRDEVNPRAGLVAVPVSAVTIPAYRQVVRDHLWNPKLGQMSFIYLPQNQVPPNMLRDFGQVMGRVLRREKPSGYVFMEEDFFPRGTRPGLVAGIPAGKRAMRVESERVFGLQGLERGDRFDLISVIALEASGGNVASAGGIYGAQMELQASLQNWKKQATVTPIVQNGMVIEPVGVRNLPTTSSSIMRGQQTTAKPVLEVVIAVEPEEVVRLTEALAVNAQLHCLPRSGQPEEDPKVSIPFHKPRSPFSGGLSGPGSGQMTTIETINGTQRQLLAAPEQR